MTRSSMFAALLFLAAAAVAAPAAAQTPDASPKPVATRRPYKKIVYKPRFPSDFAFLVPGKTTLAEAETTLGDTKWAYPTYIYENHLFLEAGLADLPALHDRAGDRKVVKVLVRVYTAREDGMGMAFLVFQDDVLLYASYPVSASETTREKLAARLGKKLEVYRLKPRSPADIYSDHQLRIPGENIFYYENWHGYVELKVIYAPGTIITGYVPGDVRRTPKPLDGEEEE